MVMLRLLSGKLRLYECEGWFFAVQSCLPALRSSIERVDDRGGEER